VPVHLDDRRLVKRLLAGDERAFGQFFDENYGRLFRFVLARVPGDEEAAAEIVQAALSNALRRIAAYRGEAALFTWLCAIARNEIVDWSRRNARYREHVVLTEDLPEIQAAVDSFLMVSGEGPGQAYQRQELGRLVQVALDALPPRYGDALEWKYIQGYSVKEIASKMGLSFEAAQSLLARARKAFQDIYGTVLRPVLEEAQS
jgi:RNA polymerase sigma-70 factor (ECF subfamily)